MDPEVNRSGKMMPIYHILKRVKNPEVLTEQLSSIGKIEVVEDLTEFGIAKPKHRRKPRKKKKKPKKVAEKMN